MGGGGPSRKDHVRDGRCAAGHRHRGHAPRGPEAPHPDETDYARTKHRQRVTESRNEGRKDTGSRQGGTEQAAQRYARAEVPPAVPDEDGANGPAEEIPSAAERPGPYAHHPARARAGRRHRPRARRGNEEEGEEVSHG